MERARAAPQLRTMEAPWCTSVRGWRECLRRPESGESGGVFEGMLVDNFSHTNPDLGTKIT